MSVSGRSDAVIPVHDACLLNLRIFNNQTASSIAGCASSAPAVDALNVLVLFHRIFWHATDACRAEVGLLGLDAARAAKLLVALLLPLCNQHGIRVAVLQQPVVELLADGLLLIVHVVDVARSLVGDLEDGPCHLVLLLALVRCVLGVLHLGLELEERVFEVFEAIWRRLLRSACCADGRHVCCNGSGLE
jgi:hypothetical protein